MVLENCVSNVLRSPGIVYTYDMGQDTDLERVSWDASVLTETINHLTHVANAVALLLEVDQLLWGNDRHFGC